MQPHDHGELIETKDHEPAVGGVEIVTPAAPGFNFTIPDPVVRATGMFTPPPTPDESNE